MNFFCKTSFKLLSLLLLLNVFFSSNAFAAVLADPGGGGTSTTGTATSTTGSGTATPKADFGDSAVDGCKNDKCNLINKYINPAISIMSAIFGLIAVISIIIGAISFATSEGDPQKAAKAKNRIAGTVFAVFAYLFLYSFLQFIIPGGIFNR